MIADLLFIMNWIIENYPAKLAILSIKQAFITVSNRNTLVNDLEHFV